MENNLEVNVDATDQGPKKEPCKILDLTGKPFSGGTGQSQANTEPSKVVIYWLPEDEEHSVYAAERALINAGGVYERLGKIVCLGVARGKTKGGIIKFPSLVELSDYGMRLKLSGACLLYTSRCV